MSEELQQARKVKYHTKDVTEPKDGLVIKRDNFWLCEDGDPTCALFFWKTAQCNKDKRVLEWSLKNTYKDHDNLQIVFIDYAYVPQID